MDDTHFDTMIDQWRESLGRGRALTAEELCRDCPELAGELDREIMIRELRRLEIPEADPRGAGRDLDAADAPMPGAEPVPGYRLVARVGRGGSGEVWAAVGPGGFSVAMKFVRLVDGGGLIESMSLESRRRARQANLRSLELMREVRHPNLLSLFGAWHRDGLLIVGMELAEKTLMDRLDEAGRVGPGGIPRPELIEYMRQAALGIDFLNEPRHALLGRRGVGIQHRDIKPQNLLLVGGSVKVGDFGLAKLLEETATLETGSLTPAYAAPELFEGRTSARSDQYSLGVTYCHLAGGRLPFVGSPWEVMMGHHRDAPDLSMLPESERPAVARALAKRPEDRWPDCRTFVEALIGAGAADRPGRSAARSGLNTTRAGRPGPAGRRSGSRKAGLVALMAVAGALLVLDRAEVPNRVEVRAADALEVRRPGPSLVGPGPADDPAPRPPGVASAARAGLEFEANPPRPEATRLAARRLVGPIADGLVAGVRSRLVAAIAEGRRAADRELGRMEARRRAAVADRERVEQNKAALAAVERRRAAERELARVEGELKAARERKKAAAAPKTATIHVLMPVEKAELVVRGEVGKGNPDEWYGPRRVIHTPPLPGRADYTVGAFWTDPLAGPSTRSRAMKVDPGRVYEVDLRPVEPTWKEIER